jgi:hypothetical protein
MLLGRTGAAAASALNPRDRAAIDIVAIAAVAARVSREYVRRIRAT